MSSGLVALSSAAVLTVYAAGFAKTKASADQLADASARRPLPGDGTDRFGPGPVRPGPTPAATPVSAAPTALLAPESSATAAEPAASSATTVAAPTPVKAPATVMAASAAPAPAVMTSAANTAPVPAAADPVPTAEMSVATAAAAAAVVSQAPETQNAAPAAPPALDAAASAAQQASVPAKPQSPALKDGTYLGWGTCRHGDIQAEVVVAGGRITSARVAQCWTRWSCSWLDPVIPQVVQRQSPSIDYVSGATQSTDAFYYAVLDALLKAK